ncbi:FAS1-like dehydratase domain-containing protein [Subtercola endophyticus]|uniref:FAS1-like dehydratase domain-containing protein n=1 Tax=Subtercola endophyticus TaxID=2895559 RepID=UPI001E36533D|nr:MaoC family dehydratase N-terminal domain-containing protein [Subtercola endophyticus]UFS58137.1 MaoC family dehydratase N-terminal domain-containing protein [Subtercola endophyticus]
MAGIPIGGVVDVVEFTVEAGKIREFACATFTEDPRHLSGELATATHSVVTGHYRDQRDFVARLGLAIERIVVGSVSWQYSRPLVSGDRLVATRRVEADLVRESKRGPLRLVTLATEFVDQGGETALVQREVLIERPSA